ncbi:MAG: chromate resistance protein [Burkholderiales bacterium]|nr:chromate resistance protein [Burkholderiales bacterium]
MNPVWRILVVTMPTANSTARMRLWRAIKGLGCGVLRDGVYLLPDSAGADSSLAALADDVIGAGGQAHVLQIAASTDDQAAQFAAMFDRSPEFADLAKEIATVHARVKKLGEADLRKRMKSLRSRLDALQAIDFFPSDASTGTALAMTRLEATVTERLSPGEPHPQQRSVARLDPADYQRRTWATRRRPWVDRIASAWLIKRFIDPRARFVWLAKPKDCPRDAIGFDFDGAEFSHVGDLVTFEVLAASFGLDEDVPLRRIAAIVHFLDVGGAPVPEAAGLERLILGLQRICEDDDQLLTQARMLLDGFYEAFKTEETSQ